MTGRDRIVVIAIAVVVLLGALWLLAVSPERKKAAALNAQVSAANAALATADGQVANARNAQTQYSAAYASIVKLGKAVPPSEEVPSLIYQLAQASNNKNVEFASISAGAGGSSSSAASAAAAPAGSSSAPTSFTQMPFRPLPPVPAARQLNRAQRSRRALGERSPAHDPERQAGPVDDSD